MKKYKKPDFLILRKFVDLPSEDVAGSHFISSNAKIRKIIEEVIVRAKIDPKRGNTTHICMFIAANASNKKSSSASNIDRQSSVYTLRIKNGIKDGKSSKQIIQNLRS